MTCSATKPVIGIIMGSESDMPVMDACMKQLDEFGVPYEVKIASAHRKPAEVHEWASTAIDRGIRVIIAAAGKAAHLGGVVAAYTPAPVIAVPMKTSDLGGLDSLLSMVQMRGHQWREECGYSGCSDDGYGLRRRAPEDHRSQSRDGKRLTRTVDALGALPSRHVLLPESSDKKTR